MSVEFSPYYNYSVDEKTHHGYGIIGLSNNNIYLSKNNIDYGILNNYTIEKVLIKWKKIAKQKNKFDLYEILIKINCRDLYHIAST